MITLRRQKQKTVSCIIVRNKRFLFTYIQNKTISVSMEDDGGNRKKDLKKWMETKCGLVINMTFLWEGCSKNVI